MKYKTFTKNNKQARSGPAWNTTLQLNSWDAYLLACLLAYLAGWLSGVHTCWLGFTWPLCSLSHLLHLGHVSHVIHLVIWFTYSHLVRAHSLEKMAKNPQNPKKNAFFAVWRTTIFFSAHLAVLVCWDHPKLPSYAISAKTNDSNSWKWQKPLKNRKKCVFCGLASRNIFFRHIYHY